MNKPTEFSGLDFDLAIGEVYGIRVWKMDEYGRLRARNIGSAPPWRPGINQATCVGSASPVNGQGIVDPTGRGRRAIKVEVRRDNFDLTMSIDPTNTGRYSLVPSKRTVPVHVCWDDGACDDLTNPQWSQEQHGPSPVEACTCGFYAYSNPSHEEAAGHSHGAIYGESTTPFVLGIIRGTGRTLIGTKGFRCEKAEIVALRDPTRGGRKTADWRTEQRAHLDRVYPDIPVLPSRADLLAFAPIEPNLPDPSSDEFWSLP